MPNFAKHQKTCYESLIVFITLYFIIIINFPEIVATVIYIPSFIVGYIIGTNWITPDLDTGSTPYNKHKNTWYLFKKLSKHRGMSHNIFLGVFYKLIYLLFVICVVVFIFGLITNDKMLLQRFLENFVELTKIYYIYMISLVVGIVIANGIHIIQDKLN